MARRASLWQSAGEVFDEMSERNEYTSKLTLGLVSKGEGANASMIGDPCEQGNRSVWSGIF